MLSTENCNSESLVRKQHRVVLLGGIITPKKVYLMPKNELLNLTEMTLKSKPNMKSHKLLLALFVFFTSLILSLQIWSLRGTSQLLRRSPLEHFINREMRNRPKSKPPGDLRKTSCLVPHQWLISRYDISKFLLLI